MFFSNLLYRNGKTACCFGYKMNKTSGNCDSTYDLILHKACFSVNVILCVFVRLMIMTAMLSKIWIHYHNFDRKHALPAENIIFDTLYENSEEQSTGEVKRIWNVN